MLLHDLKLNPATKLLVDGYIKHPKQSLLLVGQEGSGLGSLARALADNLSHHPTDTLLIEPDEKGTISIERVRSIYVETRGVHSSRQVLIIDDVDAMSHDAQNAFLKLLEEPNANVHFVLTSHHPDTLLATIISRAERIEVRPISTTDSQSLLRAHHATDATKLQQMLFIASGRPAELARMADDQQYFEEKARLVRLARDYLSGRSYERLLLVNQMSDRHDAIAFVTVLANLLQFSGKKDTSSISEATIGLIEQTMQRLQNNGHVRTQLTNLAFHV